MPGGSLLLETEGISEELLDHLADANSSELVPSTPREAEELVRSLLQRAVLPGFPFRDEDLPAELERLDTLRPGGNGSPDSLVSAEVLLTMMLWRGANASEAQPQRDEP